MKITLNPNREIVDAVTAFGQAAHEALKAGETLECTEENFAKFLYAADIPDPELLIRTSGEMRSDYISLNNCKSRHSEKTENLAISVDFRLIQNLSMLILQLISNKNF